MVILLINWPRIRNDEILLHHRNSAILKREEGREGGRGLEIATHYNAIIV